MEQGLGELDPGSFLCKHVSEKSSRRQVRCSLFQGWGQFVIFLELLPVVCLAVESLDLAAFQMLSAWNSRPRGMF